MYKGLYLVDFHAHLRGNQPLTNFCCEDQNTTFFKNTIEMFERIANFSEPFHDGLLRHMAMNYRNAIHRQIYNVFGQYMVMEAFRLFKNYDTPSLLASMDRNNIDHAVICSLEPFITTASILESIKDHRDRLSIFASVARNDPDGVTYFASHIESGQINGLKIHPVVGGYACGELFHATKDLVDLAYQKDLPILIHTGHMPKQAVAALAAGCNEVKYLEPLIANFPKARFILAHIGWESWRQVLGLAHRYSNVNVETSWQPARIIRRAIDLLGPHRVLFGSDFPLFKQGMALEQVRNATTSKEFVMVASTNAQRLLGINRKSTASLGSVHSNAS